MTEEAFREIMAEILESKVELLQAFEDLGKKFDNLINGKSYFLKVGEKGPSIEVKKVPEKESTKKGAGPQDQKIITERKTKVKEEKTRRKVVKISTTCCKKCQGHISWDDYETTGRPIHVDINGFVIGNGDCPKWEEKS